MQELKALTYIRKYRAAIIAISLLLGALFYRFCSGMQTYTASAVILYKNEDAKDGFAADGTELDTSEIYSSDVMSKVFKELDLSYDEYNLDEIRAGVTVEPMLSEEEQAVQEALNAEGETMEEEPTRYLVSLTVKKDAFPKAETFAAMLLKAMLDAYVETYAENHVNEQVSLISVEGIYDKDYDYIEMAELLRDSMYTVYNQIDAREGFSFRSSITGYTYADLVREYDILREIDIPDAYAYILNNRITKDQDVLLAKYENRIENLRIENNVSDSEATRIREIMDTYAEMIKDATASYQTSQLLTDNGLGSLEADGVTTDVTYEYILDEIYSNYWKDYTESASEEGDDSNTWHEGDQTTEYDTLIARYVEERTGLEESLVDIAYYEYIIDVYSGKVNDEDGILVEVGQAAGDYSAESAEDASEGDVTEDEVPEGDPGEARNTPAEGDGQKGDAGTGETRTDTDGTVAEENAGETEAAQMSIAGEAGKEPADGDVASGKAIDIESSEEEKETAYQMLKELTVKLDGLNQAVILTNQEYNRYAGAENIAVMTDVVTSEALNLLLYSAIAFVLFAVVGCAFAIIGGRTAEIFEYYVYVDRKTEMPNRAACDRYIGKHSGGLLPSDFACLAVRMRGIETQNRKYGRDRCDAMLGDFCSILKDVFSTERAFAAANALGQFVVFMEGTDEMEMQAYIRELLDRCREYNRKSDCKIAFACGVSVSGTEGIYDIRKLMVHSVGLSSATAEKDASKNG